MYSAPTVKHDRQRRNALRFCDQLKLSQFPLQGIPPRPDSVFGCQSNALRRTKFCYRLFLSRPSESLFQISRRPHNFILFLSFQNGRVPLSLNGLRPLYIKATVHVAL